MSRKPRKAKGKGRRTAGLSPMRRLIIMLGSAAATLGVVVALVLAWGLWSYQGPGPATNGGEPRVVMLRKGAGLTEIASTLERDGAIRSKASKFCFTSSKSSSQLKNSNRFSES